MLFDIDKPEIRLSEIFAADRRDSPGHIRRAKERGIGPVGHNRSLTLSREAFQRMPDTRIISSEHKRAHDPFYAVITSSLIDMLKGVIDTHSSYLSGALPRAEMIGYTEGFRILDFPSYSFDMSLECILGT